jgi:Tol biopolymer transport system component
MTPSFASPEQLVGDRTTPASDVYSLGVLLYLLVCGRRPYELTDKSWEQVRATVCEGVVTPPSLVFAPDGVDHAAAPLNTDAPTVPAEDDGGEGDGLAAILAARRSDTGSLAATLQGDLDAIIMRALAKSPDGRYADAGELGEALSEYLVETDPAYAGRRKLLTWRQRLALAAAVIAGVVLVGAGVMRLLGPPVRTVTIATQAPLVTWPSEEFDGHISSDGLWVSFISGDSRRELWIRPVGGEEPTRVATESSGLLGHLWSPDSSRLAYLVMTLDGAVLRVITRDGVLEQAIPVAAERPALVRWIGGNLYFTDAGALWRIDMESTDVERLGDPDIPGGYRSVDVNRSEDAIVYTAQDDDEQSDLWVADLAGANARRITEDAAREINARWYGDDGDIICLSDEGGRVDAWLFTADGQRVRVTSSPERERGLEVSSDGALLMVDSVEEDADVWRLSAGGNALPLTNDDLPDYFPSVARTGQIAFQRVRPSPVQSLGPFDADVFVLDPASGGPPQRRVADAFAPALSDDGTWLAYVVSSELTPAPFSLRVQGPGGDFLVTSTLSDPEYFGFPLEWDSLNVAWGRTSGRLYFVESGADGIERLMQASVGGRAEPATLLHQGAAGETVLDIAVSPDESRIAYVARSQDSVSGSAVYLWDRRSGEIRVLAEAASGQSYLAGWSDNGSLVVVHGEAMSSGGRAADAFIVRVDGNERRELATIDQAITQTAILDAAGRRLLMTAVNQGVHNVYALDLDGGAPRPLTSNVSASVSFSGLAVARNGDLMYIRQERNSNVWLIELATSSRYFSRKDDSHNE